MIKPKLPLHLPDAGPEADELVATHLMGWAWNDERCPICGFFFSPDVLCTPTNCGSHAKKPITSRASTISRWTRNKMLALRLVEKLRLDGWLVSLVFAPPGLPFLMGNDPENDPEITAKVKCELSWAGDILGVDEGRFRNPQFGTANTLAMAVCRAAWKTVSMSCRS